jgi:prepilin signal peptidase PulO-like enzyme (type II secretory pathway)
MPGLLFIFGLLVGSFLNAVIHRLHTGQSILEKHSRCPHCHHKLSWADLIPLISFVWLKGHCRYCGKPISWQYPAVELATGFAFVLIFFSAGGGSALGGQFSLQAISYQLIFQLIFVCFLIVIFVYDLKHYLILDTVVLPAVAFALVFDALNKMLWPGLLGAAILAGFFALLYLVSRGKWIGAGDVKLGLFLGLLVPYPQVLVLFFFAYFSGALVGVALLLLKAKKVQDRLPFGTFLTFAAFLAMLWGQDIINWYFRLIGI